jgi:alginate O-acetyltransferase complex protein AlgJ
MKKLIIKEIVVMVFLISISLPIVSMLLKVDFFPQHNENRELAKFPSFKFESKVLQGYLKGYTNYFNDHFGLRSTFWRLNFLIRYNLFRESPSSKVILGKKDWLFYAGDGSIEDYRAITHFDDNALRTLANSYEIKRKWLSSQGIRYLLVLVPNKGTIYGEWMPNYLYKVRDRSGLDEYIDYLKKNTKLDVIDLRIILKEYKSRERIYYKTGTHWNDYGAFLAYQEIMKPISQWFPKAQADSLTEFSIKKKEVKGSDLAAMIGGVDFLKEQTILLEPKKPRKAKIVDFKPPLAYKYTYKKPYATEKKDTGLPRILVFHDSFFTNLALFLSEQCQYTGYTWQSWKKDMPIKEMIKINRPDIVIEEKAERFLKFENDDFKIN